MKTTDYFKTVEMIPITLDALYLGSDTALSNLDKDIEMIVETEAPITLNVIKERFREIFNVSKISEKALTIILDHMDKFNFPQTDNLYDKVYWPMEGIYSVEELRLGNRSIYDIPYQELSLLSKEYMKKGMEGEILYRMILKYFHLEVLTEKARKYLEFVERMTK